MKKLNFFSWYYGAGLKELLEREKNILGFFWRYFSVADLARTLFYPWKRDITFRYWRGWKPLKSLEIIAENLFSRLIGAIVRSLVIVAGLVITIFFSLFGFAIVLIWLAPPLALLPLAAINVLGAVSYILILSVLIVLAAVFLSVWRESRRKSYLEMDIAELAKEKWFGRVWNRLGLEGGEIDKEIFKNSDSFSRFLKSVNISLPDFEKILAWEVSFRQKKENREKFWLKENLEKISPLGKHWKYAYTVNLDKYAADISRFDPSDYRDEDLIGRASELEVVKLVLARPEQNNVLLVGDSGTGKETLIHYLARCVRQGKIEDFLKKKRMLILDLGRVISDATARGGNVENILHLMFQEASYAGNIILVIENIENYLGKENNIFHPDVSAVMNDYLPFPAFQIIATSTPREYHSLIEKHENFMKHFEVVEMKEPAADETLQVILQNFEKYESRRVIFTYQALKHIISSSEKYNWNIALPERALDLAEEVLMYWRADPQSVWITAETVDQFLTLKTGAPQGEIKGEEEKNKLLNLEKILHQRVIGQEEAVRQVAEALRRARSGVGNPNRPVGSFLFLGPTGVGKTETAKALAEGYFGNEEKMIRLDMSEFQSPSSIDRLIGSSQFNQPGQLVSQVKDHPFSLLLLDELEKTYPDILNLFLQILDEGFVTDAFGEKINFRNIIIIATSNAGSSLIKRMMDEQADPEEIKSKLIDYIVEKNIFRLEFLNRFDGIIYFRPLNENELQSVVALMLAKLSRRARKEKDLELIFEDSVIEEIIKRGYDNIFGARSLNRFIEDKIENLIAKKIISGEAERGKAITISPRDFA